MEKNAVELLSAHPIEEATGVYIYGIIDASGERDFGHSIPGSVEEETIHSIGFGNIAAVVSRHAPRIAFRLLPRESLVIYLSKYQSVLSTVMRECTVIPVKFGTVARDSEEVKAILKQGVSEFKRELWTMKGKVELDIVAAWKDVNAIIGEIGASEEIRRLKEEMAAKPPEEARSSKIKIGQIVKGALEARAGEAAAEIFESLQGLACDFRAHDLLEANMIANVSLLVKKGRMEACSAELVRLNERFAGKINFRCVGPLPPYSFSLVEIEKVEAASLSQARALLGVNAGAAASEIKKAYWNLSQQCHPDKHPDDNGYNGRFDELNRAYKLLLDGVNSGQGAAPDLIRIEISKDRVKPAQPQKGQNIK
ncbi:MAG: GvpL/GvpF family gas vesicle protein [Acidobacteria bacterium]|nr:GvpL/GvpF family gas vesicle protein [Acidobacteriota bacterium]MBI3654840.1 GvpL/GvpF family gas vesicle protein [Acidobacteriota bacterium]